MHNDVMGNGTTLAATKQNQRNSITALSVEKGTTYPEPAQASTADLPVQESDKVTIDGGGIPPAPGTYERGFPEILEPWGTPVGIEEVANQMDHVIEQHCVMTVHERWAIVIWVIASYVIDSFRIFPRLTLISPIKRCGKTTTLEIIGSFCSNALLVANLSIATIFRLTVNCKPTLIIDEADTFVKGGDPEMIGIINSGQTKSTAKVLRCTGDNFEAKAYSTWMPMVLASIGDLASTIMDRSVVINLRRKKADEFIMTLPANIDELHLDIRRKLTRWGADSKNLLSNHVMKPDDIGNDRAADNWTALFSVANCISPQWLDRCREAYRNLTRAEEPELPALLLADIKAIIDEHSSDRIKTCDLINTLLSDPEKPWCDMDGTGKLTAKKLAQFLKPFSIEPKSIRFDPSKNGTTRGFYTSQFADTFNRYLVKGERIS